MKCNMFLLSTKVYKTTISLKKGGQILLERWCLTVNNAAATSFQTLLWKTGNKPKRNHLSLWPWRQRRPPLLLKDDTPFTLLFKEVRHTGESRSQTWGGEERVHLKECLDSGWSVWGEGGVQSENQQGGENKKAKRWDHPWGWLQKSKRTRPVSKG